MAKMPDHLKLTPDEQAQLDAIKQEAKIRHEKERKAAKRQGRVDFPALPYECSWAYEEEFRKRVRGA
jgi:hypothetical protein